VSFALDMSKFIQKAKVNQAAVAKKTAIGLFSAVIKGTPVDTGNARYSWHVDFNKFSSDVEDSKTGKAAKKRSADEVSSREAFKVEGGYKSGDTITITNNSDHIVPLEYGYSKQAPAGFVRINVAKFQKFVNKAVRELSK